MRIVLSTVPPKAARTLASTLVEERLAACVNILPAVTSVYRWEGAVTTDEETLLVIKTAADRVDALTARVEELHPYKVPEIAVLEVCGLNNSYAHWVNVMTRRDNTG